MARLAPWINLRHVKLPMKELEHRMNTSNSMYNFTDWLVTTPLIYIFSYLYCLDIDLGNCYKNFFFIPRNTRYCLPLLSPSNAQINQYFTQESRQDKKLSKEKHNPKNKNSRGLKSYCQSCKKVEQDNKCGLLMRDSKQ